MTWAIWGRTYKRMNAAPRFRNVDGKKVLVVGLGRSGASAARLAMKKGAGSVVATDRNDAAHIGDQKCIDLAKDGIRLELGGHKLASFLKSDLIVLSPGVPDFPEMAQAIEANVPVVSEIELASWYIRGSYVAITGTNGKSTVTALTGEMIKASGFTTFIGGNLGVPLSDVVDLPAAEEGGALVVELSSYQLERTYSLRPKVSVLLNVTADHLDRYGTLARYAATKQRIFLNQSSRDHAVVPGRDAAMLSMARAGAAQIHTFGLNDSEVRNVGDGFLDATGEKFPLELLKIRGGHNLDNAMASILTARLFGASTRGIRNALAAFEGLPHRMQFVLEDDGIQYFNDSKATNVGATEKALIGMDRKFVLIAGGRDKGGSYAPLLPLLKANGRALVLMGEAAPLLKRELSSALPVRMAEDMFDAVRVARGLARKGDAVLLAPACSSLDMFENYEERGKAFSAAVRAMAGTNRQEEDLEEVVDVDVVEEP